MWIDYAHFSVKVSGGKPLSIGTLHSICIGPQAYRVCRLFLTLNVRNAIQGGITNQLIDLLFCVFFAYLFINA